MKFTDSHLRGHPRLQLYTILVRKSERRPLYANPNFGNNHHPYSRYRSPPYHISDPSKTGGNQTDQSCWSSHNSSADLKQVASGFHFAYSDTIPSFLPSPFVDSHACIYMLLVGIRRRLTSAGVYSLNNRSQRKKKEMMPSI